jgi:ATP-dependent Lon protease
MTTENTETIIELDITDIPLLPLKDVVVFPHTVMPLFVGRDISVNAVTQAMANNKHIY